MRKTGTKRGKKERKVLHTGVINGLRRIDGGIEVGQKAPAAHLLGVHINLEGVVLMDVECVVVHPVVAHPSGLRRIDEVFLLILLGQRIQMSEDKLDLLK